MGKEGETRNGGEILDECWLADGACCSLLGGFVLEIIESIGRSAGCFLRCYSLFSRDRISETKLPLGC